MEKEVIKHKCKFNFCNLNQVNLDESAEEYENQKIEYERVKKLFTASNK